MKYINFNGELLTREEARARTANTIQSPLFETLLISREEVQLAGLHWDRLCRGLAHFALTLPGNYDIEWLKKQAARTAAANGMGKLCRLRLSVYIRQEAGVVTPVLYLETFELDSAAIVFNHVGLRIGIAEDITKQGGDLANLKTWDPMLYETAKEQCSVRRLDDLLVKNSRGDIVEATIANLFIVSGNNVYTPPLGAGCVEGVMRRFVIDGLALKGIRVQEKSLELDDLLKADEIFLTNAIRRIKWVAAVDDRTYTNTYTEQLYDMLFSNPT